MYLGTWPTCSQGQSSYQLVSNSFHSEKGLLSFVFLDNVISGEFFAEVLFCKILMNYRELILSLYMKSSIHLCTVGER